MKDYQLTTEELLEKFNINEKGLKEKEATNILKTVGLNKLPTKKKNTIFKVFISQFKDPLIYILIATVIISLAIQEYLDASFIILTIMFDAILGTIQEWQSEKSAESLQSMLTTNVTVMRNGRKKEISASELVPGDLVYIISGQKVPADIRIIDYFKLKVDESMITGESVSVQKNNDVIEDEETSISHQKNMLFAGSTVVSGRATGIVTSTGLKTEIGVIAKSILEEEQSKPPLIIRMERLSRKIGFYIVVTVLLLAILLLFKGTEFQEVLVLSIVLAISAIPEGLPIALTVTLSIASSRMAKENVIVRKLSTVESLGSCTLIATDKTGTLTVNKQTAKKIYIPSGKVIHVEGEGYIPNGDIVYEKEDYNEITDLVIAGVSSNEATLSYDNGYWEHIGDEMDIAFLTLGYKLEPDVNKLKKEITVEDLLYYESERGYSAALITNKKTKKIVVKGSYDEVKKFLSKKEDIKTISNQVEAFSRDGYRVLALAEKVVSDDEVLDESDLKEMKFLGLTAFIDPLRKESKEAIKKAEKAGVEVVMITGDHPLTAYSIAKELELVQNKDQVITGDEFAKLSKKEQLEKIYYVKVFARVTPIQKLEIVELLIEMGNFVAVTGDGVNDSPALRKANIGVAMGSGSDVAKDTASMIVTDDNFLSIVEGIKAGRHAYNNVRRVTYMLLSTGFAEIIIFALSLIFNLPIPLIAVQLLWLNLVAEGIQDVALAFEKGDDDVMSEKPRDPKEGVINKLMAKEIIVSGLIIGLITFGLWVFLPKGEADIAMSRNIILLLLVILENVHVINSRSEHKSVFKIPFSNNYLLVAGIIGSQLLHVLAMNWAPLANVLQLSPLPFNWWIELGVLALILLFSMEIFKIYARRNKRRSR